MENKEQKEIYLECPHCQELVLIYFDEINCAIFRHGVYKDSGQQIDPHMNKENCDRLFTENKIYGCGKPFKIIKKDDYFLEVCDYI